MTRADISLSSLPLPARGRAWFGAPSFLRTLMAPTRWPTTGLRRGVIGMLLVGDLASCVTFQKAEVRRVDPRRSTSVQSAVKAHLADGATVVFPAGFTIDRDTVYGNGFRYAAGSSLWTSAGFVPVDSVVGMETFETKTLIAPTVLVSVPLSAVAVVGSVALFKAIFGSCPTFYSDSAGTELLEAEGFSYSIAPLFEQRTVARLRAMPDAAGRVTLEVRNEALETHYLNHLELVEAQHRADEFVAPDQDGRALALSGLAAPIVARDRAGRDVGATVARADGVSFETDARTLAAATITDLEDHIDLVMANPEHADSVAVVLRLRNSLLNTVLLYHEILGAPGARSLDWLGNDIQRIAGAIDVGRWYGRRMGMGVAVWDGGTYRPVARIGDSGPIAFHDVAVLVPAIHGGSGDTVRVRLSFVVDQWRIDQIRVATAYRRPITRFVPLAQVTTSDASQSESALRDLREADDRYVVTSPGQTFRVRFAVGEGEPGQKRTFLLATQGYYTEWVRGSWIKSSTGQEFRAGDEALMSTVARWRTGKESFERAFYATRISTR